MSISLFCEVSLGYTNKLPGSGHVVVESSCSGTVKDAAPYRGDNEIHFGGIVQCWKSIVIRKILRSEVRA